MPVVRERDASLSPPHRNLSRSPDPEIPGFGAGPSRAQKPRQTGNDDQRRKLDKLFANAERGIEPPDPNEPAPDPLARFRRPAEGIINNNPMATAAAAGSGEFHVYKHSRRREFERVKLMNQRTREEEQQAEFLARKAEREAAAEAKVAKNRAKRQKRRGKKGDGSAAEGTNQDGDDRAEGGMKRKLAGGGGVVFKRPGEEDDGDETAGQGTDGNDGASTALMPPPPPSAVPEARAMTVEEREIIIHDEE